MLHGIEQQPILVVDGWRFHSTYDSQHSAAKVRLKLGIHNPIRSVDFTVKPFGVNISKLNPMTEEVTEWQKVEGYSVWYRRRE